jgi:hypothetical protein
MLDCPAYLEPVQIEELHLVFARDEEGATDSSAEA